jgi:ribosomal protein S18 acetylase RimI-like enzyme
MAMDQLQLRPMAAAEFEAYRARLVPDYAAEHVRAGHWSAEAAETLAARQIDDLLPEGPDTPGMFLLMAATSGGEPVGLVWVALDRPLPGQAWIYDIVVNPEQRGRGYGRALLRAAEQEATRHGSKAIGLNVFGTNTVARRLYETSGYQITAMNMRKELGAP